MIKAGCWNSRSLKSGKLSSRHLLKWKFKPKWRKEFCRVNFQRKTETKLMSLNCLSPRSTTVKSEHRQTRNYVPLKSRSARTVSRSCSLPKRSSALLMPKSCHKQGLHILPPVTNASKDPFTSTRRVRVSKNTVRCVASRQLVNWWVKRTVACQGFNRAFRCSKDFRRSR